MQRRSGGEASAPLAARPGRSPGFLAALLLLSCGGEPPEETVLQHDLLATDRAFARATEDREADGWASFFLEDGEMMLPGYRVRGRDSVREVMRAAFAEPGYRIEWRPEHADPGPSGETGFTTGTYRTFGSGPEGGEVRDSGRYVTLWRRDPRGRWRVRLDVALPEPTGE